MNKIVKTALAAGLALAVATPALAEFKFSGYFRSIGYVQEKMVIGDEGSSNQFVDQRFRARLDYALNDNVSVTYFAEVDTPWGETGKAAAGQGGVSSGFGGGSDGVNVETKNVFVTLKSGDTAAVLGIHTFADAFQGIVAFDDMAGVTVTHKMGNTALKAIYSKWDEDTDDDPTAYDNKRDNWDDFDFYALELKQKFSDSFNAGAAVYFMDDNRDDADGTERFFYGLNADAKFGDLGINGFVMLQDGEDETNNTDIEGWAASVKATQKIANGDIGLRLIYFSDGNDDAWTGFKGQYEFIAENQMQMLVDPFVCNDSKERYGLASSQRGDGLFGAVLSGNHNLPESMYVKWGLGYYTALDDENAYGNGDGEELGYEVAMRVGKKYFEKVDVSLNASWADYGDYFDDADGTYKTYLMVNVPF